MPLSPQKKIAAKLSSLPKLIGRVHLADFMDLNEEEFKDFIKMIEDSPLFKKLVYPDNTFNAKIISFTPYPRACFLADTHQLQEDILSSRGSTDLESILLQKEDLLKIIKKLGQEKFKKYFLYCQHNFTLKELAKICDITIEKIKEIIDLVNRVFSEENIFRKSKLAPSSIRYTPVAFIGKDRGGFFIEYFDLNYARGRYTVNYKKLNQLKVSGYFSKEEWKKINRLIKTLEMINTRKDILYRILQEIIRRQAKFLESGEFKDLKFLTQREVAASLGVNPSLITRAIRFRSIKIFQGEYPLKIFFPSQKTVIKEFLRGLFEEKGANFTDEALTGIVRKSLGMVISRRSINDYRREILSEK